MTELFDRLTMLELFDAWMLPEAVEERHRIYVDIVPSASDEIDRAYQVFEIVAHESEGLTASVADQRRAQLEILQSADTYAAVGGLSRAEIVDLPGWWAPNWAWLQTLSGQERPDGEPTAYAPQFAPELLRAGAEHLADFYGRVAEGATRLLQLRYRLLALRNFQAAVVLTIGVLASAIR